MQWSHPCQLVRAATMHATRGLYHVQEVQYDEDQGDYDQRVNPIAGARESWTYVPTEKPEQPQYE
jgi:hypothetical protein